MATSLPAGSKLHAKYTDDQFYVAEVVEWSTAKKKAKAPIKVHYLGYAASEDRWVSREDVRSKQLAPLEKPKEEKPETGKKKKGKAAAEPAPAPAPAEKGSELPEVGTKLKAKFTDGKMYAAEVLQTSIAKKRKKEPVKVHYTGYGDDEDMWVSLDDLQIPKGKKKKGKAAEAAAPAAKEEPVKSGEVGVPAVGTRLQATFAADGKFYVAEVIEVGVKVHYLGYEDDEDAWVPLSKVRSKSLKSDTKKKTKKPKKK
jgi:hypothetical protein